MQKVKDQTILLVEDTLPIARIYEECLRREGYELYLVENGKQVYAFLEQTMPLALMLDLMLPDTNGLEILQHARKKYPELPVIVVTATNSVNVAVEAMKCGAVDFIVKPVSPTRLVTTIRNALERKSLTEEIAELRHIVGVEQFHNIMGQSAPMQAIYRIIDSVAASRASVLISGESGAGKGMVARAIHQASPRRAKPFITLDCSAITHDKIDDQLFGHCEETFVGIIEDQLGAIMAARDGTLFLEEVCALPLETQAKLLQFLQTGEMNAVNNLKINRPDMRIIVSTELDALKQVHAGNMRDDLYYRLNIMPVEIPALRIREEDVVMLAQHFLSKFNSEENKKFSSMHPDVMAFLRRFAETSVWPANQNVEDITFTQCSVLGDMKPLWLCEKELIEKALDLTDHDINTAATLLQISPSALYRKIHSWKSAATAV